MSDLEIFIKQIPDFEKLPSSKLIDYFSYFIIHENKNVTVRAKDIENCYSNLNIPAYSNIPRYLIENSKKGIKKKPKYLKTKDGYKLIRERTEAIKKSLQLDTHYTSVNKDLRGLLQKITNESEISFLEESIKTFEVNAFRAAIIMVWLLTIDHLHEYVFNTQRTEFITALRRMNISKSINTKDDFADIKESVFIEACRSAGILSNDVKKILDVKLGIRNSFAHPSTVQLSRSKALDFIEDLVNNVILKY